MFAINSIEDLKMKKTTETQILEAWGGESKKIMLTTRRQDENRIEPNKYKI